jgi:hypothetical protein
LNDNLLLQVRQKVVRDAMISVHGESDKVNEAWLQGMWDFLMAKCRPCGKPVIELRQSFRVIPRK